MPAQAGIHVFASRDRSNETTMNQFKKMLEFLDLMRSHKIPVRITQEAEDSLMISFALPGSRYEVYFYEDDMVYSVFQGSEALVDDFPALIAEIKESRE
jgi:hypothetical protein